MLTSLSSCVSSCDIGSSYSCVIITMSQSCRLVPVGTSSFWFSFSSNLFIIITIQLAGSWGTCSRKECPVSVSLSFTSARCCFHLLLLQPAFWLLDSSPTFWLSWSLYCWLYWCFSPFHSNIHLPSSMTPSSFFPSSWQPLLLLPSLFLKAFLPSHTQNDSFYYFLYYPPWDLLSQSQLPKTLLHPFIYGWRFSHKEYDQTPFILKLNNKFNKRHCYNLKTTILL